MRYFFTLALGLVSLACRNESPTTTISSSDAEPSKQNAMLANSSQLPACQSRNQNQLYYLLDLKKFVACSSGEWVEIDIKGKDGVDGTNGVNGTDGSKIESVMNIGSSTLNFCSRNECYWNGGQLTTYSDGSKSITGVTTYLVATATPPEVDSFTVSVLVPKAANAFYTRAMLNAVRGNLTSNIWLRYSRIPERVTLVFDTNLNNIPEDSDELLATLNLEVFR